MKMRPYQDTKNQAEAVHPKQASEKRTLRVFSDPVYMHRLWGLGRSASPLRGKHLL